MTEPNTIWLPIVRIEPDPIERTLRLIWLYETKPVRIRRRCTVVIVVEP